MSRIIVSIYVHPEFYPPTLNAIINLSEKFDEVVVITRNNIDSDFPFSKNVKLITIGKKITVIEGERAGIATKIFFFIKFYMLHIIYFVNPRNKFLCYDPIPLFVVGTLKKIFLRPNWIWYHNHDMPNINLCRKYSVSWFAAKYEKPLMNVINQFSLPSEDRKSYYSDVDIKHIKYFFLPNYPSLKIFKSNNESKINQQIKVIYQGSIAPKRGIEEMANFMSSSKFEYELHLSGPLRNDYKNKLIQIFKNLNVDKCLFFNEITTYINLISKMEDYHVGLAIQLGDDDVRKTLGTASNKIYEYAAKGIPVIVTDNDQFRKYLSAEEWVFFYNKYENNLGDIFHQIISKHSELSRKARISFINKFNFEIQFNQLTFDK